MKSNLKKIVAKADKAFANYKPEDFLSLCADEIEWRMVGEETAKGKDEVRIWMAIGIENGDISFIPPSINCMNIIEENKCVIAFGEMEIKKKDGGLSRFSYCDIYRFKNKMIVELTSYVVPSELV